MSYVNRLAFLASAVVLAVAVGTCCARSHWPCQGGSALWELPGKLQAIGDESWRERQLAADLERSARRAAAKEMIAADLVAGRLTLADAVAHVRPLLQGTPAALELLRAEYPGAADDECIARNVVRHAEALLRGAPADQRGAVLRRLDRQLNEYVAGDDDPAAAGD